MNISVFLRHLKMFPCWTYKKMYLRLSFKVWMGALTVLIGLEVHFWLLFCCCCFFLAIAESIFASFFFLPRVHSCQALCIAFCFHTTRISSRQTSRPSFCFANPPKSSKFLMFNNIQRGIQIISIYIEHFSRQPRACVTKAQFWGDFFRPKQQEKKPNFIIYLEPSFYLYTCVNV